MLSLILYVAALVCFVAAAWFGKNLLAAGLACWVLGEKIIGAL